MQVTKCCIQQYLLYQIVQRVIVLVLTAHVLAQFPYKSTFVIISHLRDEIAFAVVDRRVTQDFLADIDTIVVKDTQVIDAVDALQLGKGKSPQCHSACNESFSVLEACCVEDHLDIVTKRQDEVEFRVVVDDAHVFEGDQGCLPPWHSTDTVDFVNVLLIKLKERILQEPALPVDDSYLDPKACAILGIFRPIEERNFLPDVCFNIYLCQHIFYLQKVALIDHELPRESFDLLLCRKDKLFNFLVLLHQDKSHGLRQYIFDLA